MIVNIDILISIIVTGQIAQGQFTKEQFAHKYCLFIKIKEFMD